MDKGNPSILWWQNGAVDPTPLQWKSYDSDNNIIDIQTVYAMHSSVVVGYVGSIDQPYKIIVSDPWASRWEYQYAYYDIEEFSRLWDFFQNTAIVVY